MVKKALIFTCLISLLGSINCEFHNPDKKPLGVFGTLKDKVHSGLDRLEEIAANPATLFVTVIAVSVFLVWLMPKSRGTGRIYPHYTSYPYPYYSGLGYYPYSGTPNFSSFYADSRIPCRF